MGTNRRRKGFTLRELLVVLAIAGLALGIGIPLVSEQFRQAGIRAAADQLATDLAAARMTAVSRHVSLLQPYEVTIHVDPVNSYEYLDRQDQPKVVQMPRGVRILSATPSTIRFLSNGSVTGGAVTVLRVELTDGRAERWTLRTSEVGVTRVTRAQVSS